MAIELSSHDESDYLWLQTSPPDENFGIPPLRLSQFTIPPSIPAHNPSSVRSTGPEHGALPTGQPTSTGLSGRGGSAASGESTAHSSAEQYELADLGQLQRRERGREEGTRKLSKREEKRRWLDEQDEMKFSHSIQFNAVPDWSSHYIAYSNLKKL